MWQSILIAEALLPSDAADGQFGPRTAEATRDFQRRYGIGVDGRVGNQTWSKADDRLKWLSPQVLEYTGRPDPDGETEEDNLYGRVTFSRGSVTQAHDTGAYDLVSVRRPGGGVWWFTNDRIYFDRMTVS